MKSLMIVLIVMLIATACLIVFFPGEKIVYNDVIRIDTLYVQSEAKIDTIYIESTNIVVDTLYIHGNTIITIDTVYVNTPMIIASLDTTLTSKDSLVTNNLKITYNYLYTRFGIQSTIKHTLQPPNNKHNTLYKFSGLGILLGNKNSLEAGLGLIISRDRLFGGFGYTTSDRVMIIGGYRF